MLSICFITYNHESYISTAIESFLMQKTDFDFDVVIGEDFSTDNTRKICEDFAKLNPNKIRLLPSDRNYGMIPNFIRTLEACRVKYIAICEGDDYWTDPYKLQKQVDLLEKYPESSMSVALHKKINFATGEVGIPDKFVGEKYPLAYFDDIIKKYFHTSTYVFRKTVLDRLINEYPYLFLTDTAIRFLFINEGPFVVLNEHVSVYRDHHGGTWISRSNTQRDFEHFKLYHMFRKFHVRKRRKFYARKELKYLHKLLFNTETRKKLKNITKNPFHDYFSLMIKFDILFLLKYFIKKL